MQIGGFQKVSLIDYPGKVSCVVFTQGCNFRCPYCHNRELVVASEFGEPVPDNQILDFLRARNGKLQGVVVTGGEPTLQPDLKDFLREVKRLGYAVKLDTNGSRPGVLRDLLAARLVDFIAMDIKAPLEKYDLLSGVPVDIRRIQESIALILASGREYQFRTTLVKPLLSQQDLPRISELIKAPPSYVLQNFSATDKVLDPSLLDRGHYTEEEVSALKDKYERGALVGV